MGTFPQVFLTKLYLARGFLSLDTTPNLVSLNSRMNSIIQIVQAGKTDQKAPNLGSVIISCVILRKFLNLLDLTTKIRTNIIHM